MNIEIMTINQFKAGSRVDGFFLIKSVECKSSSNNKKYLDFTLADRTGEINAKLWNVTEEDEAYSANRLVKVRGMVTEWQNALQFKIEKIREVMDEDGVNITDFVPVAPYTSEDMYNDVLEYINKINSEEIKKLVNYILEEYKETLMYYPAAKSNHHSVRGGLLYHITTMLKAGERLCEVYTFLNKDLLYSGIILHDISKMEEMASSELGIVSEYTIEGQLLGHIVMGVKKIETVAEKLNINPEIKMLLEHMVLSHHYEPDYGSPKKPMIPEAEMLHRLDDMDAKMYDMKKALEDVEPGSMSDRVWSLEKRVIYKAREF
ncbi:3'-5' exoribonuclease YhaM family protein [Haloimpatiens lingqiaonensis]|uniref:3'-5' exoribonuclease YhaM family protein n=1 Tax=Haloimpatiens lingqiaonensis TaxID=1380675 RepID=UPI0010FDB59E|nr:HD domain-containing protein [Haloimpatiens lingqiaonensis]